MVVDMSKYSFEITGDTSDAVSIYEYSEDKGLSKTDSQKIKEKVKKEEITVYPEPSIEGNDLEDPEGNGNFNPVQSPVNNNI